MFFLIDTFSEVTLCSLFFWLSCLFLGFICDFLRLTLRHRFLVLCCWRGFFLSLGVTGFCVFLCFFKGFISVGAGFMFSVGLVGGLYACFLCLRQVDLKSFVAYSSVCHMGLALCGFMTFVSMGSGGGFVIIIRHGLCSSCLFYLLYVFYERIHTRRLIIFKGGLYLFSFLGI